MKTSIQPEQRLIQQRCQLQLCPIAAGNGVQRLPLVVSQRKVINSRIRILLSGLFLLCLLPGGTSALAAAGP